MSDLHVALGVLALLLLAGVYAYSKWQERRALRRFQESLRGSVGDALLSPTGPATQPLVPPAPGSRIEPTFGPLPDTGVNVTPSEPSTPGESETLPSDWIEDPLLDCVLELRCAHAVDGVAVIDAAAPLARLRLSLPIHLVAWDGRTQRWVAPDRFGFYSELLAAIQLANRSQTLSEIEASQFIGGVQQLALALDADFDPPDARRMLELAAELDRLCARFDIRIGLTLEPTTGAWDLPRITAAAAACELVPTAPTAWRRLDAKGGVLFTVSAPGESFDRLLLEFDVPQVAPTAQPLRAMFATATQLATALEARVVDDNGRPVQPVSIEAIERQLAGLYEDMLAAGIEPGSVRARRLFG
ncbi:MAG: cell division protein ZipA C-terminal FtsZ-binding domain-containing protein [Gemmatimonadota bacterium]